MKVIRVDNYNRESVAEHVVKENLTILESRDLCAKLRRERPDGDDWWYMEKPDEYRLWRGREDLI